ncbi:MAG: hypothetical protein WBD40_09825 [Tepidisphaeraceae bacterium]
MVSQRKQIANQLNASKSTGPRTEDGKRRSSGNRLVHGFFSRDVVLPGEDAPAYAALLEAFVDEHRPQTLTQMGCVQRIASCTWKLWRLERSVGHAHESRAIVVQHHAHHRACNADEALKYGRAEPYHHTWRVSRPQLQAMKDRAEELAQCAPPAATLAASLAAEKGDEFTRLAHYEQRLAGMIHRALAELRKLRKEHEAVKNLPPSPFALSSAPDDASGDDQREGSERDQPPEKVAVSPFPCDETTERAPKVAVSPFSRATIERNEPTAKTAAAAAAWSASATTHRNVPECSTPHANARNEPTADASDGLRASSE